MTEVQQKARDLVETMFFQIGTISIKECKIASKLACDEVLAALPSYKPSEWEETVDFYKNVKREISNI